MSGPKTSAVRVSNAQRQELARQLQAELREMQLHYEMLEREAFAREQAQRNINLGQIHERLAQLKEIISELEECRGESWFSGGEINAAQPVMQEAERALKKIEKARPRTHSGQLAADNNVLREQIGKLEHSLGRIRETNDTYRRAREGSQAGLRDELERREERIRRKIGELEALREQNCTEDPDRDRCLYELGEALQRLRQISGGKTVSVSDKAHFRQMLEQLDVLTARAAQIQMKYAEQAARLSAEQIDAGFALSFAAPVVEKKNGKPEKEKFNSAELIRVTEKLSELDELNLSDGLREELRSLQEETDRIRDNVYLENFYLAVVVPFIKRCRSEDELRKEYDKLLARCQFLAENCDLKVEQTEATREGIEALNKQYTRLEKAALEHREKMYIDQAVDEVMREMGYELVGDRTVTKKSGRKIRHELYSLNEGTAVDVTYGANGQISMELGGLDMQDREPTHDEASSLVEDMRQFCTHYETLARRLASRGIEMQVMQLLPPDEQFTQIINISDFNMTGRKISTYSASRQKKTGQQTRHVKEKR